jgi:transcriptional repressor NrdR
VNRAGQEKLECPHCGCLVSLVTNSRPSKRKDGIWRRRQCVRCSGRFSTEETIRGSSQPKSA